ncbi:MAG: CDP-glucose 4,6-dehydratase, partial [Ruthenibacterium sp.]
PDAPHEASFLKLDCSRLKSVFGWQPTWHIDETMEYTCAWYRGWLAGEDINALMQEQIEAYTEDE